MGDEVTAEIIANKLKAYGVDDHEDEPGQLDRQKSVYFVDGETGEVSRPGTAAKDGLDRSCPTSKDAPRGSPSPRQHELSPRVGILRPRPSDDRPLSSGAGDRPSPRQALDFEEGGLSQKYPPRRPVSSGSHSCSRPASRNRPSSCERPRSGGKPSKGSERDRVVKAQLHLPELEPLAGFGVDVSVVHEVEEGEEQQSPVLGSSLEGGDSVLTLNDQEGHQGEIQQEVQAVAIMVGEEESEVAEEEEEEPPGAEPAVLAERNIIRILRFVSWFKDMGMNELRDVSRAGLAILYPQGTTIVEQGDDGDSMFVVIQGSVHVETELSEGATVKAQKHQAHVLEEGHTFGESAIVWVEPDELPEDDDEIPDYDKWWKPEAVSDGWDYTAREWTVVAETDCMVLELARNRLLALMGEKRTLERGLRVYYEQIRAASAIQRAYREYAAGKDAAKKMADMLARAAAAMAEELKSLTPHAQAYMAMMSTMSHAVVAENQVIGTPPPLRRPKGYVSRTEQAMLENAGGKYHAGKRSGRGQHSENRSSHSRESKRSSLSGAHGVDFEGGGREHAKLTGVASPVFEGDEEADVKAWDDGEIQPIKAFGQAGGGKGGGGGLVPAGGDAERDESGQADQVQSGSEQRQEGELTDGAGDGEVPATDEASTVVTKESSSSSARFLSFWMKVSGVISKRFKSLRRRKEAEGGDGVDGQAQIQLEPGEGGQRARGDGDGASSKPRKSSLRPMTKATTATTATGATGVAQNWRERNWTLLVVTVIQCQELPRRNYRGALGAPVDATIEVSVDDVRYTIPAPIKRTCAPYFNETFAFQLLEPEDNIPEPELAKIEIVDAGYRRKEGSFNKKRRRGDSLGIVFVPIAGRGDEGWHYLQNIKGEVTVGRVKIRTQRIILEGARPSWYVQQCPAREAFRIGIQEVKAERRKMRVGKMVADMVEIEANKPKPPKPSNQMHPEGSRRQELDMFVFFCTFVVVVLAPMAVCFDVQSTWAEWNLLVSTACDGIFMFDMYTRFYTGFKFLDAHGNWKVEDRATRCRSHYLDAWRHAQWIDACVAFLHSHGLLPIAPNRKAPRLRGRLPDPPKTAGGGHGCGVTRPAAGWFWLDLLTCFPAEIFLATVRLPSDPYYRSKAILEIGGLRTFLRLLQGAKVLRVLRLRAFLDALQRSRSTRLRGGLMIKVVMYAILWVHWVACLWFAALRAAALTAGSSLSDVNSTYTEPPALHKQQTVQGLGNGLGFTINNKTAAVWWTCDDREKLLGGHASAGGRYICALHWATQTMLAVGMGDVPLLSPAERLLAVVAMPLGMFVAMTVAAAVGSLLPGAPTMQARFAARVRRVSSFLKVRALPKDFRKDVQRFYEDEWVATGGNDDLTMLRPLPLSLQVRAIIALHGHVLQMVPFFNARINDLRFWKILLKGLEQVSYMEGEWLMREGETAEHLFLIKSGQCELISERFEGQGLDEDGRPRNKAPVLPDQGPHSPQWELLDWEEETRRAKDVSDGVGAASPSGPLKIQPFDKAARTHSFKGYAPEMDPSHFSKTAPARRLSLGANDMGWNVEDSAAASDLGVSLDATTNVSLDAGANESDQDGGRDAVMVVPAAGQDAELSLFVEGGEPPDGPFGPDPRAQSRGWGWKGDGPRPWWSPMAMGRGSITAWGRDKTVISLDSNDSRSRTGRSIFSAFSRSGRSPTVKLNQSGRWALGSVTGRSSVMSQSIMSASSASTGGTWAVPRPTFLSNVGLQRASDYIQQYIYIPDWGPPPDWLPLFLHSFWPTGSVRGKGAGQSSMHVGGSTTMSTVSFDESASHLRSGAVSPTRSGVSLSGVSAYGKGGQNAATSREPDEPPFLYGKYNTDAFFGDVAMAFGGEGTSRLRPASVRATEYVRVLRIGRKTLEELATEFPHDIGKMLHDMALKGRMNMARMRWHMVWGKHRLQILRESESIVNPQEPWPYNDIILDDIPDLPPIYDDGLGVEGEGGAGTSEKIFETPDIDMLAIEDAKPVAEKKRHSPEKVATARLMGTAGSLKRKKSSISGSGGSLAGRVKARQEREGAASAGSKGSSDRSRATTPASKEPTSPGVPGSQIGSGSNSSSPSRRHAAAARAQYDEPTTPRPTSPMQGPGKFRMLRCL